MAEPTRWATDNPETHSQWYADHFRSLAAEGADLAGEARLLDAMLPRGAHVLDAGCGQGRLAVALHAAGHRVVGVDADPTLIDAARRDSAGPTYLVADLSELDLAPLGIDDPFDGVAMAGNVMPFLAPGTEVAVLRSLYDHLRPDGVAVVGFGTGRGYALSDFDAHTVEAGFAVEHRFATWDLRPWRDDADFSVTILRRP